MALFNRRVLLALLFWFVGVTLGFFAFHNAVAQNNADSPVGRGLYRGLSPVVHFDTSLPLRDIAPIPHGQSELRENEARDAIPRTSGFNSETDPVVQSTVSGHALSGPFVSFDGPSNNSGVTPPDPSSEVGPNHVVVIFNSRYQVFNKKGTSVFGPADNNTIWIGFGPPCETEVGGGSPRVLYDQLADRWLLTKPTDSNAPYFQCVAISTTPDPTGSYFRYAVSIANYPDAPKFGIWPNAYYFSASEYSSGVAFVGVGAYALNRTQMLAGNPSPQVISFLVPPGATPYNIGDGLLPADLDGMTPPPAGSPAYFVGSMDNNGPFGAPQDALTLWKFIADFSTPANSSFVLANTIPVAAFNSILALCGGTRNCIPQPGTANRLDHYGYRQRPLPRLAYRNFGSYESLVTNQSVSAGIGPSGEVSGIRWWELRSPNSTPVIFQEGTYAPGLTDGIHRWMGSIAMDGEGNMALGYSASSATVYPSLFYTGRYSGSVPGTMPAGEGSIINGTGSQTGSQRWGGYSAMSVDPTNDLTFWYVNQYIPATSSVGWRLRIGSFQLSNKVKVMVTTIADHDDGVCNSVDCTLREAINVANASADIATITFASVVTGTIQLGSALPNLSANMILQGPGADLLAVRRNTAAEYRIFTIDHAFVDVSGLTITNGRLTPSGSLGAGIYNNGGTLTLTNCAVTDNTGYAAGGVYNEGSSGSTATIRNCTFSGNTANEGGAIDNAAIGGSAMLSVWNSTFSANSASNNGGAISTGAFTGNASLLLTNCTFSGNSSPTGGGVSNGVSFGGTSSVTVRNTIFKTGASGANLANSGGTITSQGHNLSNDAAGGDATTAPGGFLNAAGDKRNMDPILGSLGNNGGPTPTHALLGASPAINMGDNAFAPAFDQRSFLRVGTADIGAFEFGGILLRITNIVRTGNDIVITFNAAPGKTFRLERRPDLGPDSAWNNISGVSDLTAVGTSAQFTHSGAGNRGFYRVVLLP